MPDLPPLPSRPAMSHESRRTGWWRGRMALLRALAARGVRDNEFAIVLLGVAAAIVVALGVAALQTAVRVAHTLFFGIPLAGHLSEGIGLSTWSRLAVPALGGLVIGLTGAFGRRWLARNIVDPIEANALYGGKMSILDSLRLAASTVMSNAAGASVGMEAAYTQLGAGSASLAGQAFNLRRADLRVIVGCGAAAAIAAAFNAPIAGAFYAFELVIGSYTLPALAPVCLSAITAGAVAGWLAGGDPIFSVTQIITVGPADYPFLGPLGIGAALLGILTMQAVTWIERLFRASGLPPWARPAIGGLIVGAMALGVPQVLGSGHGAIQHNIDAGYALPTLAILLAAKTLASALSIGSGFRGGLFSSALFLGSLYGALFSAGAEVLFPHVAFHPDAFLLIGMGSVAAAIIGAPITMVMLVQEATGDFPVTFGVLTSVVVASLIVRQTFGYSFATWRFHLRGVPIRGAFDIGWIEDLTVDRLMRRDPKCVPASMSLEALRRTYPLGAAKRLFVIDETGQYAGILDLSVIHDPSFEDGTGQRTAGDLAHGRDAVLLARDNVRTALKRFVAAEQETLPVLDGARSRRPVGYLTEAYALRRYTQELERKRMEDLGERRPGR